MKPDYFIQANDQGKEDVVYSPSKKYRLRIRYYDTSPGCWNYSRGLVERVSDNQLIADVKRNYGSFTHSFVTQKDVEWLITGRSYMSQTIINLETRAEYQPPGNQEDSYAFCWVNAKLSPDGNILVVEGCHWACPYEFRFYDFSDPTRGWPELTLKPTDTWIEADSKWPVFASDGTLTCFQTKKLFLPLHKYQYDLTEEDLRGISDADYQDDSKWELVECERRRYRPEKDQLIFLDNWVSEPEQARRQQAEEDRKKFDAWLQEFKSNDPLYLRCQELIKTHQFSTDYLGFGTTYPNWAPNFSEKETRCGLRILQRPKDSKDRGWTVDLEWAAKTGPIKLSIFRDGKTDRDEFFPHSIPGMNAAFELAAGLAEENKGLSGGYHG